MGTPDRNDTKEIKNTDMLNNVNVSLDMDEDEFSNLGPTGVIEIMKSSGRYEAAQLAEDLKSTTKNVDDLLNKAKRLLKELQELQKRQHTNDAGV